MINKKLLSFDRKALRYVGLNVLFQWLGMLCNVVLVMTVSRLIGGVFAGSLTGNALWQGMLLCLLTVPVRYGLTLCASDMSDRASKDVKRTLRSSIYAKLTRLGAGYSEMVATSEAVMLASEGVEQIDTYFAKYLPQLFYSLLAPVTLADFCRSQSGLATALHEGGSNLSGGQRQRLAMARALLHDSPIYVFDEATSNVDAESENDIMKAIHSLAGKKTVILISHRLANVVDSDCIYVLEAGRIAEQGTHNDLLAAQGVYSRLYNAQKQLEDLGEVSA